MQNMQEWFVPPIIDHSTNTDGFVHKFDGKLIFCAALEMDASTGIQINVVFEHVKVHNVADRLKFCDIEVDVSRIDNFVHVMKNFQF